MSSTQGALLQAREETTLCSENSGQFPHVFLLREKLKTTGFSSKASHVHSRELPAGIEVYSVELSIEYWIEWIIMWLCLLIMDRCKWLLAGPGKGPGEWGESGFWQAGLWNKYQQQARSTGTSRWGFSRKCSLFGGLQKDLEIQGVSLSKQAEERRKSSTRTQPSAAQRRGAAAGVMEEFCTDWFCPAGMTFPLHITCSPHRKLFIAFSSWVYVSLFF